MDCVCACVTEVKKKKKKKNRCAETVIWTVLIVLSVGSAVKAELPWHVDLTSGEDAFQNL